jgi:hypothetical protein
MSKGLLFTLFPGKCEYITPAGRWCTNKAEYICARCGWKLCFCDAHENPREAKSNDRRYCRLCLNHLTR